MCSLSAVLCRIAGALICDGIEVLTRKDIFTAQLCLNLIAVFLIAVKNHGEVGVVPLCILVGMQGANALDAVQTFKVAFACNAALGNLLVDMAQVTDAHHRFKLVHTGVRAHIIYVLVAGKAEVYQILHRLEQLGIPERHNTALNGVEHLGGMGAEHGSIAEIGGANALIVHAEGVRRIIDYSQVVLLGNGFDRLHVTHEAVNVGGYDGHGLLRDGRLDQLRINGVVVFFHVDKHRRKTVANDCVCGGTVGIGGRDDLALHVQCVEGHLHGHMAVGKQIHVVSLEILLEQLFKFHGGRASVGQPAALPYRLQFLDILLKARHRGPGHIDSLITHIQLHTPNK